MSPRQHKMASSLLWAIVMMAGASLYFTGRWPGDPQYAGTVAAGQIAFMGAGLMFLIVWSRKLPVDSGGMPGIDWMVVEKDHEHLLEMRRASAGPLLINPSDSRRANARRARIARCRKTVSANGYFSPEARDAAVHEWDDDKSWL